MNFNPLEMTSMCHLITSRISGKKKIYC